MSENDYQSPDVGQAASPNTPEAQPTPPTQSVAAMSQPQPVVEAGPVPAQAPTTTEQPSEEVMQVTLQTGGLDMPKRQEVHPSTILRSKLFWGVVVVIGAAFAIILSQTIKINNLANQADETNQKFLENPVLTTS